MNIKTKGLCLKDGINMRRQEQSPDYQNQGWEKNWQTMLTDFKTVSSGEET